jgi:anti-anti-sigma regulatory factor
MQEEPGRRIAVEGSQSLQNAAAFKDMLIQALTGGDAVSIDLHTAESVDVSTVQLLLAAASSAAAAGTGFSVRCAEGSAVARQFAALGFSDATSGWLIQERVAA